jgi:large subunit ribosomal protein L13
MKTVSINRESATRKWYVVDLTDKVLGRAATRIADVLRGKHKPSYTPHDDTGDFIVVINAEKVRLTGKKWDDKVYHRHTMHPGGLKSTSARQLVARHPEDIISLAVQRMIPRTPLGRRQFKKLHVYAGAQHPHAAQKPEPLAV